MDTYVAKIGNFGVSRQLETEEAFGGASSIVGTEMYQAPEQIKR